MPWTLYYPLENDEDRLVFRADISRFSESLDVGHVEVIQSSGNREGAFVVHFEDELEQTTDALLLSLRALRRNPVRWPGPPRVEQETRPPDLPLRFSDGTTVPEVPTDVREQLIAEYLRSAGGRQALAQSMIAPLRRRVDYTSVAQRVLNVEQLPEVEPIGMFDPAPGDLTQRITSLANGGTIQSGASIFGIGAAIAEAMGGQARVTGLQGMDPAVHIGWYLHLSGGLSPGNEGRFQIVRVESPSSVYIANPAATLDYSSRYVWAIHPHLPGYIPAPDHRIDVSMSSRSISIRADAAHIDTLGGNFRVTAPEHHVGPIRVDPPIPERPEGIHPGEIWEFSTAAGRWVLVEDPPNKRRTGWSRIDESFLDDS